MQALWGVGCSGLELKGVCFRFRVEGGAVFSFRVEEGVVFRFRVGGVCGV